MRALDQKLLRDLMRLRGVVLAIALVLVGGVSTFIMSLSTYDSLLLTQAKYYRDYRFAQVFASLKRAPEDLRRRILHVQGVDKVETRVVAAVNLDIPGFGDPASGQLVSVPDRGEPLFNGLYLRRGRLVDPARDNEVVISESFANAHRFQLGDTLSATINGRRKELTIVGIVLSPEYIYEIQPGAVFPDYKRFGILWMARAPLAAAYDMEGAFNDIALSLTAEANLDDVIDRIDEFLRPYGGRGAYGRHDQLSHKFLAEEFGQLETMATVFPVIFLGVAAFLLNVVIGRLINTEREQIAILKAFGYRNAEVGWHYTKLSLMIVAIGLAGGVVVGVLLGKGMSAVYQDFYRFPFLEYELKPSVVINAALVAVAAGLAGTLFSVARAIRLPPAEGMRPETPPEYRATLVERAGLQRWFAQPTRMIMRHIERRPLRALMTVLGIASACGVVMVSNFQEDAVHYMIDVQYGMSAREDLSISFVEPTSVRALHSLRGLFGVAHVEGFRSVPARLHFGHRSFRAALQGLEPDGDLHRVLDKDLKRITIPAAGVVMTDYLAKILGMGIGDWVTVEVLEDSEPVLRATGFARPKTFQFADVLAASQPAYRIPLVATTKQYLGVSAYLQRDALNRLLQEGDVINGAYISTDSRYQSEVYTRLKEMPRVSGTVVRQAAIAQFNQTMEQTILFFTMVTATLGAVIAFGVVYNSARIALSERGRELASLRVLGFTVGEIAYILLGELAVLTLIALPFGFMFGRALCAYLVSEFESDLYRIPLVLEPDAYSFATVVILVSAIISGYLVWRRLRRLDLIAVLKTRE
jgi:putative ABC transport system permease protein